MSAVDDSLARRLYVITDRHSAKSGVGSLRAATREAVDAGARFFQYRDKDLAPAERHELGVPLARLWSGAGARVLVNGRADLAVCLGLDGVHRPGGGLPVECLRESFEDGGTVAASTHDREELVAAEEAGADFATLSPVFRSSSKPAYGPPLGLDRFERLAGEVEIPVYALGGIRPERVEECLEAGADGVAVMSGIMGAEKPGRETERYLEALQTYGPS